MSTYCSLNVSRINLGFVNKKHLGNKIVMWYINREFGDSFKKKKLKIFKFCRTILN